MNFEGTTAAGDSSADGDNTYVVTVRATDSHGVSSDNAQATPVIPPVTVTITVTDVNEAPTVRRALEDTDDAPVDLTSNMNTEGMAADHEEKYMEAEVAGELNVASYSAEDPEGAVVTLTLMGDDADKFELNDLDTPVLPAPRFSPSRRGRTSRRGQTRTVTTSM